MLGTLRKADNKLLMQAMSKTLLGNVTDSEADYDERLFEESLDFFQVSLKDWSKVCSSFFFLTQEGKEECRKGHGNGCGGGSRFGCYS